MFRKRVNEAVAEGGNTAEVKAKKKRKPMSKKKKRIIIAAAVVLVVALVIVVPKAMGGGKTPPLPVTTGSVEKMDIEEAVTIKGTIQGSQKADVATSYNYKIMSILVHEGDIVQRDQVLAVLDSKDLQDEYQKAVTSLNQSKFNYESSKSLYEEGAISKEEYLKAEGRYQTDKLTVNSLNITNKINIKSPIAGTVTRVNVNIGRYAYDKSSTTPMFVVEDLQKLKMNVRISEHDISKIRVGQKVTITAEVLGTDSVDGIVSRISPTGELKDAATSKEMVIPVQIDVTNKNPKLIAGVTAKAKIEIRKKNEVLSVPIDSILLDPNTGDNFVMKLNGTKLKKIPVKIGIEGDFNMEITSGDLKAGDKLVLNPTFDMTDGMEVTPATGM